LCNLTFPMFLFEKACNIVTLCTVLSINYLKKKSNPGEKNRLKSCMG
jgi:hypothetical protein